MVHLAGNFAHVAESGLDVLVQGVLGQQLPDGALAALHPGHDVISALDDVAGLLAELLVIDHRAQHALAGADVGGHLRQVVHGGLQLVVELFVDHQLADGALALGGPLGEGLEIGDGAVGTVVKGGIFKQLAQRPLAGAQVAEQTADVVGDVIHVLHNFLDVATARARDGAVGGNGLAGNAAADLQHAFAQQTFGGDEGLGVTADVVLVLARDAEADFGMAIGVVAELRQAHAFHRADGKAGQAHGCAGLQAGHVGQIGDVVGLGGEEGAPAGNVENKS